MKALDISLGSALFLALAGNFLNPAGAYAGPVDSTPVVSTPDVAQADTPTPAAQPADSAKAKRAREFFGLANAYAAEGLIDKANEYWTLARELDPSVGGKNAEKIFPLEPGFVPPEFKPNHDRPYNRMVKILYEQAVESYANGDTLDTVNYLKEAEKIDPIQPQVQDFLGKLQGPPENPVDPLEKVKESLKNGKNEEALAELDDYLDDHPDDEEALKLKDKIESARPHPKVKKHAAGKEKASLKKTPTSQDDQAAQAQADQAYNLGLDSYRQGDYAAAKKFWEETLEIEPTHLQARHNLDRLLEDHPELK